MRQDPWNTPPTSEGDNGTMRTRFLTQLAAGAALSLFLCRPALPQERGPIETARVPAAAAPGEHDGVRDLIHCLRVLDLTDAQKTAIQQFIQTETPTLQALHDTLKADRQTLHTDASATSPDPCKVGSDFLTVRADYQAIEAEIGKIKTFIEGQLTDAQKARFEGCVKGTAATTG